MPLFEYDRSDFKMMIILHLSENKDLIPSLGMINSYNMVTVLFYQDIKRVIGSISLLAYSKQLGLYI